MQQVTPWAARTTDHRSFFFIKQPVGVFDVLARELQPDAADSALKGLAIESTGPAGGSGWLLIKVSFEVGICCRCRSFVSIKPSFIAKRKRSIWRMSAVGSPVARLFVDVTRQIGTHRAGPPAFRLHKNNACALATRVGKVEARCRNPLR